MKKRGSKITIWMLVVVFCAFALAGCGDTKNDTTEDGTDQPAAESTQSKGDNSDAADRIDITITSPEKDTVIEGGAVTVVGKADGVTETDGDTVKFSLTTDDDRVLAENTSLIADLDYEFSGDLKYTLSDKDKKNDDGTVNAVLRCYIEDDSGKTIKEETVKVKLK